MDGTPERRRAAADSTDVPRHLADALDRSAEDLREGRVEDARAALTRLERRLGDHLARKRAAADAPAKG